MTKNCKQNFKIQYKNSRECELKQMKKLAEMEQWKLRRGF